MAAIITCSCGAKVRVPAEAASRTFGCPKCKAPLSAPPLADSVTSRPLASGESAECPICQTQIAAGEEIVKCEVCDQVHHRDCWAEIGGCGTYGCAKAPAVDKSAEGAPAPLSAWGDTKKCPACGEVIKAIALRCRYCGTDFSTVDPLSVADLRGQITVAEGLSSTKQAQVVIFAASIVGCLAPLMLIISLLFVFRKHEQLAKCGPLFVIMGWASVILSGVYSLGIVALLLTDSLKR